MIYKFSYLSLFVSASSLLVGQINSNRIDSTDRSLPSPVEESIKNKDKFLKPVIIELNAMTFKSPITIFNSILKKIHKGKLPSGFKNKLILIKNIITSKKD